MLVGGLIAGSASVVTTVVNQNGENTRVERRLDEEARGAARVLMSRFTVALRNARYSLKQGHYSRLPQKIFVAPISTADLELVTGRLSADEFHDVDVALQDVAAFVYAAKVKRAAKADELTPYDQLALHAIFRNAKRGRTALLSVADLPHFQPRPAPSEAESGA